MSNTPRPTEAENAADAAAASGGAVYHPRRGRPAIGPQVTVRMTRQLRDRIELIQPDGEPFAETVRRILDHVAPPDIEVLPAQGDDDERVWLAICWACAKTLTPEGEESTKEAAVSIASEHADSIHTVAQMVADHLWGDYFVPVRIRD